MSASSRLCDLVLRAAAAAIAALLLAGCATTTAPTYTDAAVTLRPCPAARVAPHRAVRIPFTVTNRSHRAWPAAYLLLTLQGAGKGFLRVDHAPSRGIGGGIRRVTAPLKSGARLVGSVTVHLAASRSGSVNVGAWGAPANSVAVPSSYVNPGCALRP